MAICPADGQVRLPVSDAPAMRNFSRAGPLPRMTFADVMQNWDVGTTVRHFDPKQMRG